MLCSMHYTTLHHQCAKRCVANRISIVNVLVEKLFDQLLEQHNWKHELNIYCAENRHEMFKSSVAFLVAFFFLLCSSKRIIDLGISLLWHKHGTWKPTNLKHIIPFSQAYWCPLLKYFVRMFGILYGWYFICLFLLMIPLWNAHLLRNAIQFSVKSAEPAHTSITIKGVAKGKKWNQCNKHKKKVYYVNIKSKWKFSNFYFIHTQHEVDNLSTSTSSKQHSVP